MFFLKCASEKVRKILNKVTYDLLMCFIKRWLIKHWFLNVLDIDFKCDNGMKNEVISPSNLTWIYSFFVICVPRTLTSYGDRAFSCVAPKLWDSLPVDIRMVNSLDRFKAKLKHYFFNSFIEYKSKLNMYKA